MEVDHSEELAGFERCRHGLWGHEAVRALGLALLPTLVEGDIYSEGDALSVLESEIQLILTHVPAVAEATQFRVDYVTSRCHNILRAVRRAQEIGGGVVIW